MAVARVGFRERVRMARPDGGIIVAKLESPGGGLVMVAGSSPDFHQWIRERVLAFASSRGGHGRTSRTHQPWGLRSYAAFDLEGHQWEFSQLFTHRGAGGMGRDSD